MCMYDVLRAPATTLKASANAGAFFVFKQHKSHFNLDFYAGLMLSTIV